MRIISNTDEKLPDEDRGHLCEEYETKVHEQISGQVLNIEGSGDVEIIVDNPNHGHVENNPVKCRNNCCF